MAFATDAHLWLKAFPEPADNEVIMATQSTAQCAQESPEEIWVAMDETTEKMLSDIARRLTSLGRSERIARSAISQLAKIFGGGLRTVW